MSTLCNFRCAVTRCALSPLQTELAHQGQSLLDRIQQLSETAANINEDEGLLEWEVSIRFASGLRSNPFPCRAGGE